MIVNFEEITYELDNYEEKVLVPVVSMTLANRIGKRMALNSTEFCKTLQDRGYVINDARLRKIVHYIRVKNIIKGLMATSKGYYVSDNPEELKTYCKSLRQRETSIHEVRVAIENYINEL